jgi:hypothetical protein
MGRMYMLMNNASMQKTSACINAMLKAPVNYTTADFW